MEQKKEFVTYADGIDKEKAVITIGGREYAVVPMYYPAAVPAQAVDFGDKHDCDGLGLQMWQPIRSFMEDLLMHLEHCAAFTVTEEEEPDENIRRLSVFLPILLPLDERDRWCMEMTSEQIRQITDDGHQRIHTGRPRAFKIVNQAKEEG